MDSILTFIGLMKRADSIAVGAENAYTAAREGKARLLLIAKDASKNTVNGAQNAVHESNAPLKTLPYTKGELGEALGQKECAALAVIDTGFALSLCEKIGYIEEAGLLKSRLEREKKRKSKKLSRASDPRKTRGNANGG